MTWMLQLQLQGTMGTDRGGLTPVQRLRQAELSWLRSGQTTTLFSSETEKDPVSEARGGMASIYPPCLRVCGSGPRVKTSAQVGWWASMALAELCNAEVKLCLSSTTCRRR